MPLLMMCGFPCSGKTRRVEKFVEHVRTSTDLQVNVIFDEFTTFDKNTCYSTPSMEKVVRGSLKSNVERLLSKDCLVIVDSLNYIKGFRYELYCVARQLKTTHCVVQCECAAPQAKDWNKSRDNKDDCYTDEIMDALIMRFEPPDDRNRWDNPLFIVLPEDEFPNGGILDALLKRVAPPPNQSTQSKPLSSAGFLHDLDRRTQEVISAIMEGQRTSFVGDSINIPNCSEKLTLNRHLTMGELSRLRRQFITYSKMHPVDDSNKIPTLFVQYLQNTL
ncbi:protein KTI12 homolog [Dysidea avara]|uniref:protein KTI12 homolog n=1 Tax=Dysidea avara TaxID=196820 RepID=UPI0033307C25